MNARNYIVKHPPCLTNPSNNGRAKNSGYGWSASNWSGYAITGKRGAYSSIAGDWFVPFVKPSCKPTYSSAWIGIDGFRNSNLIQTGTGHEYVNGAPRYYAWWEILPEAETIIPFPVSPGDHMRGLIQKICRNKWSITLRNLTRKWKFHTIQNYSGPQNSAEWILEAPQVDGSIAKLARLSPTRFIDCRVNAKNPRLKLSSGGIMIQNNVTLSIPSSPNRCGNAFIVKRANSKTRSLVHSRSPQDLRFMKKSHHN